MTCSVLFTWGHSEGNEGRVFPVGVTEEWNTKLWIIRLMDT